MSEIQVTASLKIHEGKLDEFKMVAAKCMNTVREKDSGTLQYDWFLSKNHSECHVIERYKNSDAALEHTGNLGEILGELLAVIDLSLIVYGEPSDKLKSAMEGLDIKYYSTLQKL